MRLSGCRPRRSRQRRSHRPRPASARSRNSPRRCTESPPLGEAAAEGIREAGTQGRRSRQGCRQLSRLLTAETDPRPPVKTPSSGFAYRTNRSLSAALKQLYEGRCQFCGATFEKNDGTPYCETHHVRALSNGGHDTADNMLALCPTCHRKMHHARVSGATEVLTRRTIRINGEQVAVTVRPEHLGGPH